MNLPKHVAVILDGNRRYGEKYLGNLLEGHYLGTDKLEEFLDWCKEFDIQMVTVWAFSTENFNRSEEEVKVLMNLLIEKSQESRILKKVRDNKIKINILGRLDLFPENVQAALKRLTESTKDNNEFILNIALGYGGKQEIVDAAKKLVGMAKAGRLDASEVDKKLFSEQMYIVGLPDPELIIRTGGRFRTSGFMLWQSEYSEWYYTDTLWPDFSRLEFIKALAYYEDIKRNFGK